MEEYNKMNKKLKSVLSSFELNDISNLRDILLDLNSFNEFDNLTLCELINNIEIIVKENKTSRLSKLKEELNNKFLNQYIKYSDDDNVTILKKVKEILVDPAFGDTDFAIKFISDQVICYSDFSIDLKVRIKNNCDDYDFSRPIVFNSDIKDVEIISKEEYDKLFKSIGLDR